MNTVNLHPEFKPHDTSRRMVGIGFVILLHLLLGYALVTGTARTALELVKKPLQAVLVEDVIIPPPPPPPPPKEIVKPQAPKVEAPPPPFVPPPDIPPPVAAPAIQSVATPPPAPVVIAPPPPVLVPVPTPPEPSGPVRNDIKVACPTQTPPEMPRKALQDGTSGVVKAQVLIRNGAVAEVTILSGPKVFHQAVRNAMMQYKCQANTADVLATQEFAFKIEE